MSKKSEIIRPTSSEPWISKYFHQKGCALGLPISGNFELTARCNFDCKMCYVHKKDDIQELKRRELSADQWLGIASDAKDMGMLFLLLTGGEPFIKEDFEQIYRELNKMGLMVSINTNASLYDGEIRRLLRYYPPTRLNVTLYGGSESTYQSLCGNASFHKVVNNLRNMKDDGLQVRLNVSLTPDNVKDMEAIHQISNNLNLQAKATSYMYPPVRVNGKIGNNAARFDAEEAGKVLAKWNYLRDSEEYFAKKVEKIRNCQSADLHDSCIEVEQEGVRCRAGRSSFWLTWDGKMLPCGIMDVEPYYPLKEGFKSAWDGLRKMVADIRLPIECGNCKWKSNCAVCAANCKCETGDFSKRPEYLCKMVESQCKEILTLAQKRKITQEKSR